MSGIAGVLYLDGRDAQPADAMRVLRYLAHRGEGGMATVAFGPAAFGTAHSRLRAAEGGQRFLCREKELVVALDGRVDNRDELADACGIAVAGTSDAALIAEAYTRWGLDAPVRILGAHAYVIWDQRQQQLLAVRDVAGQRPFCYRRSRRGFTWASEVQALVEDERPPINEGYVAEHLAGRVISVTDTVYADVFRLPAAHALHVRRDGTQRTWRYWQPACEPLQYRDERECIERAATLLRSAVAATLGDDTVTISLSSGIDSSSIAVAAAEVCRGRSTTKRIDTVTVAFPGHRHDESVRAAEVARSVGLPWTSVPATTVDNEWFVEDAARTRELPMPPNATTSIALRELVRGRGQHVLLSGVGGDEWFFGSDGRLADLIGSGRLVAAGRYLAAARLAPNAIPTRRMLWWGIWGATPPAVKQVGRALLQRPAVPAWITSSFTRTTDLRDRFRAGSPLRLASHTATTMFDDAVCGDVAWRQEMSERVAAWAGIDQRYPYGDRRLIEFAFSLPDEMRYRQGRPKWIVRQTTAQTLPAWMLEAPPSTDFSWLIRHRLEALGGAEGLDETLPVRRGWVDLHELRKLYAAMLGGQVTLAAPLWTVHAVDLWLKAIEQPRRSVAASQPSIYDTHHVVA